MKFRITAALIFCSMTIGAQDPPPLTVWDGVFTEEQSRRGQPLYNQHCASCHGDTLTGGEMAPPLVGGEFLSNWNGLTVGDLFERIRTTMPLSKPGKLSREVNADITAYMLAANQFPAGTTELSRDTQMLKQIRIDVEKPKSKSEGKQEEAK